MHCKITTNKKALAMKPIFYGTVVMLLIATVALLLYYIFATDVIRETAYPEIAETEAFTHRFINCFSYQDPKTQHMIPNTIDIQKFNQANLDYCFSNKDPIVQQYQLTLKNTQTNQETTIKTHNFGNKKIIKTLTLSKINLFQNNELKRNIGELKIEIEAK